MRHEAADRRPKGGLIAERTRPDPGTRSNFSFKALSLDLQERLGVGAVRRRIQSLDDGTIRNRPALAA